MLKLKVFSIFVSLLLLSCGRREVEYLVSEEIFFSQNKLIQVVVHYQGQNHGSGHNNAVSYNNIKYYKFVYDYPVSENSNESQIKLFWEEQGEDLKLRDKRFLAEQLGIKPEFEYKNEFPEIGKKFEQKYKLESGGVSASTEIDGVKYFLLRKTSGESLLKSYKMICNENESFQYDISTSTSGGASWDTENEILIYFDFDHYNNIISYATKIILLDYKANIRQEYNLTLSEDWKKALIGSQ